MKYKDWLEKWLVLYVKPTAKEKTYDRYSRIVCGKLIPALGEIELTELTTLRLQEYVVDLSQKFAVNTINGIIAVIKSSLKSAIVAGLINQNPTDGLRRPKREEKKIESFSKVTLNSGLKTIGNYAFNNCSLLTEIVVPDSVTSIGLGAFSGCSAFESITIPFVGAKAGVTVTGGKIPYNAFCNCTSLTRFSI